RIFSASDGSLTWYTRPRQVSSSRSMRPGVPASARARKPARRRDYAARAQTVTTRDLHKTRFPSAHNSHARLFKNDFLDGECPTSRASFTQRDFRRRTTLTRDSSKKRIPRRRILYITRDLHKTRFPSAHNSHARLFKNDFLDGECSTKLARRSC